MERDRSYWLRRAHACADRLSLDQEERQTLAWMLNDDVHEHQSWSTLSAAQLEAVVRGVEAYAVISHLLSQRLSALMPGLR